MSIINILAEHYDITFVSESFSKTSDLDDSKYLQALTDIGVKVYAENLDWDNILKKKFDVVIFEFYFIALLYLSIIKKALPSISVVVDSVDVHFSREIQMAEVHKDEKMLASALENKKKELAAYKNADRVWVVTDSDKEALLKECATLNIDIVPNIHTIGDFDRSDVEKDTMLFIGNFWHQPNEDAMIYFCNEIFPKIKAEVPQAIIKIVGNAPTKAVKELASDSIQVIGWVPDTKPYLEKCCVSVVPLRYGAGLKGKVGEAMSAGMPVVTTSIGVQGMDIINGKHLLVSDKPEGFAEYVINILKDNDLRESISINGKEYLKAKYSTDVIKNQLLAVMKDII